LPKVAVKLRKTLEKWEDEYGRPFLVHGERYIDELDASEAKPPPGPRSKTPAGPPPQAAKSAQKSAPPSRANSVMRPPPARSGAKTPGAGDTLRRNPTSTAGGRTPSRIPAARPPLSNLQHGNNSPERRTRPESRVGETSTIRKMGPPPRAPPPKMRDIFVPPPVETPMQQYRSSSVESGTSVRHVALEDVYDDRHYGQQRPQSYHPSSSMRQDEQRLNPAYQYPSAPTSRQISNTSSATTTISGSENWETYDDVSEPEQDATEAYYAKLRAARGKRDIPYEDYAPQQSGQMKKLRGIPPIHGGQILVDAQGNRIASGSEANWTDEDAF
jgi:protein regulator of cytokinesis 1